MSEKERVQEFIRKMKPEWNATRSCLDGGKDFVQESFFSFSKDTNLWVVITCGGTFAWKEVCSQWIDLFSNLILQSPQICVEFDFKHKIVNWAAGQEKVCPLPKQGHLPFIKD